MCIRFRRHGSFFAHSPRWGSIKMASVLTSPFFGCRIVRVDRVSRLHVEAESLDVRILGVGVVSVTP
jgi:hypothetical protein